MKIRSVLPSWGQSRTVFVLVSGLLLYPVLSASSALAADVTIDSNIVGGVYGNSPTPDGLTQPPDPTVSAADNSVTVNSGGTVSNGNVSGGYAANASGAATASGNTVTIGSGGTVNGYVYGGFADSNSGSATAAGNKVAVSGGTVSRALRGGGVWSGSGTATVTGNTVVISGGRVDGDLYGGNAVTNTGTATTTGNTVVISGGTVGGVVYGGFSHADTGTASATGNTVVISGGTVALSVYGGFNDAPNGIAGASTHNTVTLSGSPVFGANTTTIAGGINQTFGAPGDTFTGNTLNVLNYSGSTVFRVHDFQYYNFTLPAGFQPGDTVLSVTSMVTFQDSGVDASSIESVNFMGGGRAPQVGETFTLINAGSGFNGTIINNGQTLSGQKGAALLYDAIRLDQTGNLVTATVTGNPRVNPQMKALSEGYLSGAALINQGADLIAGPGMKEAVRTAKAGVESGMGLGVFGTLSGGKSRYGTGSHVDMDSVSLMTGLSWGKDVTSGRLSLGAFFEYGNGSYDTYNSFSNAASVHGDGDIYHLGGGVLGRMDFKNSGPGHLYAEASGRVGSVHHKYSSADLHDSLGRKAKYDSSSAYYGLHLGAGYVWEINDKGSLDLYGKYFWTRQEGDSVKLSTGDPVKFKDVDSNRLRFGGRFAYVVSASVSPYIGAAWEHEFAGKARATTYGYGIDAPSLRGDTGIGEIGVTLKPSATLPLSLDIGVQGYVGKRKGVTGSLQGKWAF